MNELTDFKALAGTIKVNEAAYARYQQEEKRKIEEQKQARVTKLFGARYADCTFDNYEAKTKEQQLVLTACQNYSLMPKHKGESIILYGTNGTGKNHLITAITRKYMFSTQTAHIDELSASKQIAQKKGKSWMKELDKYCTCHYFVIPDLIIRDSGLSDSVKEILFYIIDKRYSNLKPIIIGTNEKMEDLRVALDYEGTERIYDRLKEMVGERVCCLNWESYRK